MDSARRSHWSVACSTIVLITVQTAAGELARVEKAKIFERFADTAALAKAVNMRVEHVSLDVPSWTDW